MPSSGVDPKPKVWQIIFLNNIWSLLSMSRCSQWIMILIEFKWDKLGGVIDCQRFWIEDF